MAKKQLRWQLFPRSLKLPTQLELLIHVFEKNFESISSFEQKGQSSDQALAKLRNDLVSIDFKVESGKTSEQKVNVPVLFGEGGKVLKSFDADAYSEKLKTVLEVEAGRAYANNQFLKDIFQASVMQNIDYCAIAVRQSYRDVNDFEKIYAFLDTLYSSNRLSLPLVGLLLIGY